MNNKSLGIGLIIFGLLLVALITHNGDIAWMMLPFLIYLGAGVLQAPVLEKVHLRAKRTLEQSRSNGVPVIDVNLKIENQSVETVYLSINETSQAGMKILEGELSQLAAIRAGESTELKYTFTATRGNFSWKSIQTRVIDPLDLVETEIQLPAGATIQIRPQIKKFKAIPFRPHGTLHAPGSIPARLGGSGTDFFGVREYHPGDSLRWLDWRLTARHPRKFFTKEFEQEEIAEIGLILDSRRRTNLNIGGKNLFESSIEATASLAEMFLHQGQRVSLLVFGETLINAFPGYGKQQLQRIMNCLSRAKIGTENSSSISLDLIPLETFPTHALLVIISPISSDDRSFFLRLRAAGYQVLLISPDPVSFAYPVLAQVQDDISRLAIRATRLERRLRLNNIASLGIPAIDWQVERPLFPMVRNALIRSRGQRER
jgi:uncharacterized protein (DUF58 family)